MTRYDTSASPTPCAAISTAAVWNSTSKVGSSVTPARWARSVSVRRSGSSWAQRASDKINGARHSSSTLTGLAARAGSALTYTTVSVSTGALTDRALVVDRELDQSGLEAPVPYGGGHLRGVEALHPDLDVGVPRVEVGGQLGQQVEVGAAERPERDRAAGELTDVADRARELVEVGQHPLGPRDDHPAGVGELQPAVRPGEEPHTQHRLEPADLVRQAGLRDVETLRGGRERAVLNRGEEVRQLLHARLPLRHVHTLPRRRDPKDEP